MSRKGHHTNRVRKGHWGKIRIRGIAVVMAAVFVACQINEPPRGVGFIPDMTILVGDTEAVTLSAYFWDPNGDDTLRYDAYSDDTDVATVYVSGDTVTVTAYRAGTARITVTATDPDYASVSEWFTVDVPSPDTQPSFGAQVVANQTYTAGEPITPLVLPQASGGNGALTYALVPTVPGLTFDPARRTLTGTPTHAGTYAMTYSAVDGDENTATSDAAVLTFDITITQNKR